MSNETTKKFLIITSDTGGGHTSAGVKTQGDVSASGGIVKERLNAGGRVAAAGIVESERIGTGGRVVGRKHSIDIETIARRIVFFWVTLTCAFAGTTALHPMARASEKMEMRDFIRPRVI